MKLILGAVILLASPCWSFILEEIIMDEATFEACSTCDARADRATNAAAANALREYMTTNHVKLIINSNDGVEVTKRLPDQKIDTGHSCSKTAEAIGVSVNTKMTKNSEALDSLEMDYDDFINNSFITGDVPHKATVTSDIRIKLGFKLFGRCKTYARKTCKVTASSTGMNHISVNLHVSDSTTSTLPDGTQILQFKLNVDFLGTPKPETYSPFSTTSKCKILGLVSINRYIQKYSNGYTSGNNAIDEIRGPILIKKLETLLKAKFGDTVTIPVKIVGPSIGGRKKRGVQNGCKRMKCPSGFSRLGNSQKCLKSFRTSKPNCAVFGTAAFMYERKIGSRTYYWCIANMIPQ